jgi:DNA-binding NtrC family response regulator
VLRVLQNIFSARGYSTRVASDASALTNELTRSTPALVIWDQAPAEADLNPAEHGFAGPILILAQGGRTDLGARATVVSKPYQLEHLVQTVMTLLD